LLGRAANRRRDDGARGIVGRGSVGVGDGLQLAPANVVGIVLGGNLRALALFLNDQLFLLLHLSVDRRELALQRLGHRLVA
jgi:hypothetical protein